jgi:hypothetical protein
MSATIPGNPIKDDPKLRQLLEELDSTSGNRQYQQPRMATIISATSSGIRIKDDPKLQQLLKKLDSVNSNEQFQRWRNSFLKEFVAFLDDAEKTARAELIFADFGANLAQLTKLLKQLQGFLENGDLTADTCTVKARQCLTEVGRQTTVVILQTEALVPGTSAEEKKAGYTKFNVGAALIRDGFVQYGRLQACTGVLEHLRTKTCVEQVADRQILQEMELHGVKASIFCDVMADLGIFKVMTRCRELDVMEVDDSAGELKPYELENEAPASPPRPKKSLASPQTPKSSKTPKKPCELEIEAPASPPRPKKSPTRPQTPNSSKTPKKVKVSNHEDSTVLSIPAAKGSYDKSEKAVQARRIGKVDDSSPAEDRRREEDQYKPVERMDKNLKSYYHGSDGPSPFFFLDKKREEKDDSSSSSGSGSDEEGPPSKKVATKPKQKKTPLKKENAQGTEEERGDGGGIDEEKRPSPETAQTENQPRNRDAKENRKKEADEEDGGEDPPKPLQESALANDDEFQVDFDVDDRKKDDGDEPPDDKDYYGDDGAPDKSPLKKNTRDDEDEDQEEPDIVRNTVDTGDYRARGEPPMPTSEYSKPQETTRPAAASDDGDGIYEEHQEPVQELDKPKSDMRPSTMRGASFSDGDGGGIPEKPHELVQKPDKPKSDMRPSTMRGASFCDDEGGGVPEKIEEPLANSNKPKSDMRPSTMRGASFSDDEGGGGVPEKHHDPVQKPDKPKRGIRPSTMRGASFSDDEGGGGVPEKSEDLPQLTSKSKSGMRSSIMRGASFCDDEGGGVPGKIEEPLANSSKPKSDMRLSTMRGASFSDDEGGGGVPEEPNEFVQKPDKPKSDMRPSTMRGASFSDGDGGGIPEKPHELVQKADKPKSGMRPAIMRGASFSDGDGSGIPEKCYDLPSGMRPATMRRASSGDDDSVPQQSTLMRPSPFKRVENQPIDPAPIKDETERNKDTDHIKKQVKPAKIPSDDNARGIEGTPSHHSPTAFIATEKSVDVKTRVVQSAPTKKKKAVNLVKRTKCLMWHARMSQPNRTDMKRRVADLPECCDITVADVDALPWMPGGKRLNVIEMNKLFLRDD